MIKMDKKLKIKQSVLTVMLFIIVNVDGNAQPEPAPLVEYFNKSIIWIAKDSLDSLHLRAVIFELINQKTVANDYTDIVKILGYPCHTHLKNDGSVFLVYPLAYNRMGEYGSVLMIYKLDKNKSIIVKKGFIHFMETDEDLNYWYSNPPKDSKEGDKNSPPMFRM